VISLIAWLPLSIYPHRVPSLLVVFVDTATPDGTPAMQALAGRDLIDAVTGCRVRAEL
jgi:hypothetical protein